ncbi:MAG TPA: hypothetical protein QF874_01280 [Pelagibacteraceae bacterium]|nr:hypothetical protein [Pelagibacteraceae bacterium]
MNSRVIIIAILIMIKVIGVASKVRAQTWESYCNSQLIAFEKCDEDRETKSIEEFAFEHKQNKLRAKAWNEILKNNPNIFK